jgi:hypothetical protein
MSERKIKYSKNNKTTVEEKVETEGNPATVTDWQLIAINLPAVVLMLEKRERAEKRGEGHKVVFFAHSRAREET